MAILAEVAREVLDVLGRTTRKTSVVTVILLVRAGHWKCQRPWSSLDHQDPIRCLLGQRTRPRGRWQALRADRCSGVIDCLNLKEVDLLMTSNH